MKKIFIKMGAIYLFLKVSKRLAFIFQLKAHGVKKYRKIFCIIYKINDAMCEALEMFIIFTSLKNSFLRSFYGR